MQQEQEGRQMQVVSVFCCPAVEHPAEATPITNIEQGFYFSANSVSYLHMFKRLLDYCITMSNFFFWQLKIFYIQFIDKLQTVMCYIAHLGC
jgi:hypothetical protein